MDKQPSVSAHSLRRPLGRADQTAPVRIVDTRGDTHEGPHDGGHGKPARFKRQHGARRCAAPVVGNPSAAVMVGTMALLVAGMVIKGGERGAAGQGILGGVLSGLDRAGQGGGRRHEQDAPSPDKKQTERRGQEGADGGGHAVPLRRLCSGEPWISIA